MPLQHSPSATEPNRLARQFDNRALHLHMSGPSTLNLLDRRVQLLLGDELVSPR